MFKRGTRGIFLFAILFINLSFISAEDWKYNYLPQPSTTTTINQFNSTNASVNNSQYLEGHPASYFQPAGSYLTSETDPIYSAWIATNPLSPYYLASNPNNYINSSYNASYVPYTGATANVNIGNHKYINIFVNPSYLSGQASQFQITDSQNSAPFTFPVVNAVQGYALISGTESSNFAGKSTNVVSGAFQDTSSITHANTYHVSTAVAGTSLWMGTQTTSSTILRMYGGSFTAQGDFGNGSYGGEHYGVGGYATGNGSVNYGGYFTGSGATTNYGVYANGNTNFLGTRTYFGSNGGILGTARVDCEASINGAVSTAPLKLRGITTNNVLPTLLTSAELGAIEFLNPSLYFSIWDGNIVGAEKFTGFLRTKWTISSGWDTTNGGDTKINHNSAGSLGINLKQTEFASVVGQQYKVVFTVDTLTAGGGYILIGNGGSQTTTNFTATGNYTLYIISTVVGTFDVVPLTSASRFSINAISITPVNVSRKEIVLADTTLVDGKIPVATTNGRLNNSIMNQSGNTINVNGNIVVTGNLSAKRPYWNGYYNATDNFINTANVQRMNLSNNLDYDSYLITINSSQAIKFSVTGDYLCIISPEFFQSGGGTALVTFWMRKNGVDVKWTNSRFSVPNNVYNAPSIPFQFDINNPATDYIEFYWWSDSTSTQLYSSGALTSPTLPSIPAVITNCQKVSEIT